MSVAVRRSLYGKLAGDTTLNALLGTPPSGWSKSIFYETAPQSAPFPYVIFNKQSGTPSYAMSGSPMENDIYLVKGVDRSDSADGVENISDRLHALLTDSSLTISGRTHLYLRRESDVDYSEVVDGVTYRHSGSLYRLVSV